MAHLCEVCKKVAATIHLTNLEGGVKREFHVCEGCAQEKGIAVKSGTALPKILAALAQKAGPRRRKEPDPRCEACGMTWSEFRAKGRLGCVKDYEVFRERLAELLGSIHGRTVRHAGKRPGAPAPAADPGEPSRAELERRLKDAIAREAYEEAAAIRDRLDRHSG